MAELISSCCERESLGGGVYRQVHYVKPVAYRRENVLKRITNKLGNTGDSVLTIGVDELVQFRIRDRLAGQSPTVHFGKGNSHVKIHPVNTNNVVGQPVGESGFIYPDAWNGADLEFVIGGHILRKSIHLKPGHPSQFAFEINDHIGLDFDTLQTPDFRILNPALINPNGIDSIGLEWAKSVQGNKLTLTANLPAGNYSGWILDPTLVLQPDAAAGQDVYLDHNQQDKNFGVTIYWGVGRFSNDETYYHGLIKFDISSIPTGSTVDDATFYTYVGHDGYSYEGTLIDIYEVASANSAWIEGTKDNAQAGAGEPCWDARAADGSGGVTTAWAGSEGASTAGTDYVDSVIGTFTLPTPDNVGDEMSTALTASVVEGWITSNPGMFARARTESGSNQGGHMASSDHTTAAYRPKLVVVYTLAGGDAPFSRIFAPGFRGAFG